MGAGVRAARPPPRRRLFPGPRPRHRPGGAWRTGGRSVRRPTHVEPELARAVAAAQLRGERVRVPHESAAVQIDPQSAMRSEEHTSELQSRLHLVCRLLLEKKK